MVGLVEVGTREVIAILEDDITNMGKTVTTVLGGLTIHPLVVNNIKKIITVENDAIICIISLTNINWI